MARYLLIAMVRAGLLTSCGFRAKKYDDPITKDTKQPDKVLFDRAIDDIEHGRYEIARITLNTLINTYDQSEFLAKAKLAIADSWYREGGAAGLAQAEAEYKDFILFYPTMEEAAESQQKICMIHYKQMDKVGSRSNPGPPRRRRMPPAYRAVPEQQVRRRDQAAAAQYPGSASPKANTWWAVSISSAATIPPPPTGWAMWWISIRCIARPISALWDMGQAYGRLGNRFRKQEGEAYSRIVRDYPLSDYADDATRKLKDLEMPVPEADKAAVARMQYEKDHRVKPGLISRDTLFLKRGPDVSTAAHQGDPAMTNVRPSVPPLVPQPAGAGGGFNGDVTATPVGNSTALDTKPDARANPPATA